jgi:acetylglutamate kinase
MNRRILMKIGGKAFDDRQGYEQLARAMTAHQEVDFMIVHGGGAEISQALQAAGRQTRFVDGIRVTEAEDVAIVDGVLSQINERISKQLNDHGVSCRGMSGKTEGLLLVEPMVRGTQHYGFVGEITQVNPGVVLSSLLNRRVPVISPISMDKNGLIYNVNADSAAAALAIASRCTDLIYFTDVTGVQIDGELCAHLSIEEAEQLIAAEKIKGGMVAKLKSAFDALHGEVPRVHILKWQGEETLIQLIHDAPLTGTTVHR